jgi:hypothetical protein
LHALFNICNKYQFPSNFVSFFHIEIILG